MKICEFISDKKQILTTYEKLFKLLGLAAIILIAYLGFMNYPKLELISGFRLKVLLLGHFMDNRTQELIENGERNRHD
jgi:hypothetical protein